VAARWLTAGVLLEQLCRALNAACARRGQPGVTTTFRYAARNRTDGSHAFLRDHVDRGLPCLLGWTSRELGNHTSLVVGYDAFSSSGSRWLRLADPIRMQEAVEWRQLGALSRERLEVIYPATHDGARPDKVTLARDGKGAVIPSRTMVERWSPSENRYASLIRSP
jgi:hypothetical protein